MLKGNVADMQFDDTAESERHVHEPPSYWQKTVTPIPLSGDLPSFVDVAIVGVEYLELRSAIGWLEQGSMLRYSSAPRLPMVQLGAMVGLYLPAPRNRIQTLSSAWATRLHERS